MSLKLIKFSPLFLIVLYFFLLLWRGDYAFDADLGLHLAIGRIISLYHYVPMKNLFSYTYPNFPWFTNSWFSALTFYEIFSLFGKSGLLYVKLLIISLTFFPFFIYAWKTYSQYYVSIISMLLISIYSYRFSIEPELFSFLCLSLFLLFIELYRKTNLKRFLWLLVPIELLWVNLHIFFFMGIMIYSIFLIDQFSQRKLKKEHVYVLLFIIFAVFINPMEYRGTIYPLTFFPSYGGVVVENMSIVNYFRLANNAFSIILVTIYLYIITASILIVSYVYLFTKKITIPPYYIFLSIIALVFGEIMIRLIPVFAFTIFFPLLFNMNCIDNTLLKDPFIERGSVLLYKKIILIFFALVAITIAYFTVSSGFGLYFQEDYKPAVDFIQRNHIQGPMFNSYDNGGYLIFRLYPQQRVFISPNNDAFPTQFMNSYGHIIGNDPKVFERVNTKYRFNYIIFYDIPGITSSFLSYLLAKKEWVPVYADGLGNIIFLRDDNNNKYLIKTFALHRKIEVQ